ncbi:Ger(x)C family spore germination protein [Clostridium sp.]|uniref:Ger(x)C family spore germination protein n=1 Tax=Clostridium sp. TaxID=1506 RepID=UPI003D6D33AF
MKRYSLLILSASCIIIYLIFNSNSVTLPIENIDICSGLSFDINAISPVFEYDIAANAYSFPEKNKVSNTILEGIGKNVAETRSNRQTISSKKFLFGAQKVFIFSEALATYGINPIADIMFSNQQMNNDTWIVVCKDKALDILKFKVEGTNTSSDYISGMIKSSEEQNFMSDRYKVVDMLLMIGSEGRNLVLPSLEIINNKITLVGMAIFKKDKMVSNIPMSEAMYMNILKEDKVKGILTLQKDSQNLISNYGLSKKKVKCEKIDGKYKFTIDIEFNGEIINNSMYKDFMINTKTVDKYSQELEEQTKKSCNDFINKMQNEYKVDCLELGRVAAATYGRNPDTDWDNIVCNSDIIVNVKVKVNNLGRGQFLFEKNDK